MIKQPFEVFGCICLGKSTFLFKLFFPHPQIGRAATFISHDAGGRLSFCYFAISYTVAPLIYIELSQLFFNPSFVKKLSESTPLCKYLAKSTENRLDSFLPIMIYSGYCKQRQQADHQELGEPNTRRIEILFRGAVCCPWSPSGDQGFLILERKYHEFR